MKLLKRHVSLQMVKTKSTHLDLCFSINLRAAFLKISDGGLSASPFPEKEVDRLREEVRKVLREHGFDEGRKLKGDAKQRTRVRLVQSLLEAFQVPDHYFANWWAKGVWVGSPDRPLPRTPAIFDRKTKWAIKDDGSTLHGDWSTNYSSLREHEQKVLDQYAAEIE